MGQYGRVARFHIVRMADARLDGEYVEVWSLLPGTVRSHIHPSRTLGVVPPSAVAVVPFGVLVLALLQLARRDPLAPVRIPEQVVASGVDDLVGTPAARPDFYQASAHVVSAP